MNFKNFEKRRCETIVFNYDFAEVSFGCLNVKVFICFVVFSYIIDMVNYGYIIFPCLLLFFTGCQESESEDEKKEKAEMISLEVTASAYNAMEHQTKVGNFRLAAWGDLLEDDIKAVAVSKDLIALGLDHNAEIQIEGLDGTFIVKDKMNRRWNKKIDIFMGLDELAAKRWGKRQVEIRFNKEYLNDKLLIIRP